MLDFQNDFYYILERYGARQYFIGEYRSKKTPSKTATKEYEKNCRGAERDKNKLIEMYRDLEEMLKAD
mgnify:CR=1 FL=1